MKVLVLGSTGMAGHIIALYFNESGHNVTALSRTPFPYCENIVSDVTNFNLLNNIINNNKYEAVINAVGSLNKNAEDNKSNAVLVNSYLPHFLSQFNTKIIHMSTDCVFSGRSGGYEENSLRDGDTFYDRSKALGELDNKKDLTFRNSIIGPDMNETGIGLFNWFMKQNGTINGYTKAIWTGVSTLTLARAMEKAIENDLCGIYHLVNNSHICKYDLLQLFNKYFKDNSINIKEDNDFISDKSLINNRTDFPFIVPSYEEMVHEMQEWSYSHKELYPHILPKLT